ncbi:MAG: hypothetical protein QNJ30_19170 [Kiloniellales bacterium]|nr:hypothetical protein [Kiloniellales bacterium]
MRRTALAACLAVALGACAPDLSKVAGDYAEAVTGADEALTKVVDANTSVRKRRNYSLIADERPTLRTTAACGQIFDLAGGSGGAAPSSPGAADEEGRATALKERQKLLEKAAEDCAVETAEGAAAAAAPAAERRLRDPLYLCGIDPAHLTGLAEGGGLGNGKSGQIPPPPPRVEAQARVMPALAAYASALKEAAEAKDIEALEEAAQKVADAFGKLAAAAGPYGVAAAPVVTAVGNAAVTLTGAILREKRFRFIKKVVVETDPAVRDSAAIACHAALVLSFEIVRDARFRLGEAVEDYNLAKDAKRSLEEDRKIFALLETMDSAVVVLREVGSANYVEPLLGVSAAHASLKSALEDPDHDFAATIKLLKKLAGQLEEIKKATEALAES